LTKQEKKERKGKRLSIRESIIESYHQSKEHALFYSPSHLLLVAYKPHPPAETVEQTCLPLVTRVVKGTVTVKLALLTDSLLAVTVRTPVTVCVSVCSTGTVSVSTADCVRVSHTFAEMVTGMLVVKVL
jgi:hypothetical protein